VLRSKSSFTLTALVAALGLFVFAAYGGENTMKTTSASSVILSLLGEKTYGTRYYNVSRFLAFLDLVEDNPAAGDSSSTVLMTLVTVEEMQTQETSSSDNEIIGVIIKNLKTHKDPRGFFREVVRSTDELFDDGIFGQWSHSKMQLNVVKAWHYHHVQTDWWYCPIGKIQTVLFDNRPESATYRQKLVINMGDSTVDGDTHEVCVKIPPGVLHGCKVLSNEAHLFYITSTTYDPNEEGRFPYDSAFVGHDWGANALTVENDRREFQPTSTRKPIA
jgi:dTDP-4-dehydrorhamnose 3,5-epimerase